MKLGSDPERRATPSGGALVAACLLLSCVCSLTGCGSESSSEKANADAPAQAEPNLMDGLDESAYQGDLSALQPVEAGPEDPIVQVFGDSLGAGLHLPDPLLAFAWVSQRRAAEAGHPFHLRDSSTSGRTTQQGRRWIDWVLEKNKPDVVVVVLGGNDGLQGREPAEIEADLDAMLKAIRKAGAEPVLIGMNIFRNLGPEYVEAFEAIYPRLAQRHETAYVADFLKAVGQDPELMLKDGLHPNAMGHAQLAERLTPVLIEVLKGLEPRSKEQQEKPSSGTDG